LKSDIKNEFAEAVRLQENGDFISAKEKLLRLAEIDPQSAAVFATLGNVYWEMGLLMEAVNTFKRAVGLAPRLEAVSLGLFHCLWTLGKREEAMEEAKRFMSVSDSANYRDIVNEINRGQ